jgi:hypothetical protein
MVPLKMMMGREMRNPLSIDLSEEVKEIPSTQKALVTLKAIKEAQGTAFQATRKAQQKQENQVNKKRRPVNFYVHNKVFFKKKGFVI